MARDEFSHLVSDAMMSTTIGFFKQRAAVIIEEEQAKPNPDNHLIQFACDAIRLAREYGSFWHTTLDTIERRTSTSLVKSE
jgi:hypothetical protein